MTDEQINEVMLLADELADACSGCDSSHFALSHRKELESYLRTIGNPAGNDLRWAAEVVEKYDDATTEACYMIDSTDCAAILTALAEYRERFNSPTPKHSEPKSVNAELLEALKSSKNGLEWYQDAHPESASECDNEAMQEIDAAIAHAESAMPFWPDHSSAISDPLFHQARGIMGTENFGQEEALRLAILHVLNARAESAIKTPYSADTKIGDALNDPRLQEIFGAAIEGAMGFGYQDTNRPPEDHWLERFWKIGAAQQEADETRACETCGGRGEVGGFVGGGAPGYETHPCPDCRDDEVGGA